MTQEKLKIVPHSIVGREVLACLPQKASSRPPLLFVHGAFAGAWIWADTFMPYFAKAGYPCYALSLLGHGNSVDRDRIDWLGINDYVDDVKVVADWIGTPSVLVGHSMGGFVVQKYLEQHFAPAAALLCSVPPQGLVASQFHLMMQKPGILVDLNKIMGGDEDVSLDTVREALFAQPVTNEVLEGFRGRMQRESQRALWDMSLFNLPMMLMLRGLPPLFVAGAEHDMLVPEFMVRVTAQTYGVSAHIFEGLGHAITHEQDWLKVADKLKSWLDKQMI